MRQVVIENPVLNSPFEEPERHFRFGRWAFVEIDDPWDARNAIRGRLREMTASR